MGIKKGYRVRIINYDKNTGKLKPGAVAWVNDSRTLDINEAFRIRSEKHRSSSNSAYVYTVEEWVKGMP
jgi:hypothetical protein